MREVVNAILYLARSGCRKLSINMPGTCLPQELKAVRAIQRLGIDVWGFFMFGFSFHDASVFRRVVGYYGEGTGSKTTPGARKEEREEEEDAFDMRKPMKRDKKRESIRENGEMVRVPPESVYF